jgi:beta-galactosidase GanA
MSHLLAVLRNACAVFIIVLLPIAVAAAPMPALITDNGRHTLLVDGEPYIILGSQTNNSSNYPAALKDVWPSVKKLGANTLSIPVAWEQLEPVEGTFDFSYLDVLLKEAKTHEVKLILLWFGTWKNNAPHYAPAWVKLNNKRFPRVVTRQGGVVNSLSPLSANTLNADKTAFIELMKYLQRRDRDHRVIMVQVQNEVGTYGAARDYSPAAQAVFLAPVPTDLTQALNLPGGSWSEVFGADADEFFHAYHIARYCDQIAAAGKAIKNLPMYVNVALRHPVNPGAPGEYSSGGATDNVIPVWKAAAPNIDFVAPDIYFREYHLVEKILGFYSGPTNALFVAEIGNDQPYARYFFSTLGRGGIGISPFGMDDTGYTNYPLGARSYNDMTIAHFASLYRLVKPMEKEWAKLSFEGRVWGVAEPMDEEKLAADSADASQQHKTLSVEERAEALTQTLDLGMWDAVVTYGRPMFWVAPPEGNSPPAGGALIAQLAENEYLITGFKSRVELVPSAELKAQNYMIERVEEGRFERGRWKMERVWNGDQTDWGLNFAEKPHLLRIKMATYSVD